MKVAGGGAQLPESLEMTWAELWSPRERHRRGCSPNSVPGLLLVHLFTQQTFIKPTVLSQTLRQNLGVQHGTSEPLPCVDFGRG